MSVRVIAFFDELKFKTLPLKMVFRRNVLCGGRYGRKVIFMSNLDLSSKHVTH